MTDSWVRDRDKPFATLLSYCGTYLHPDVYYGGLEQLKYACSLPEEEQNIDTKQFIAELRRVIVGDRDELPKDAIFKACYYDDGSEEKFVKRLWSELFPNEPLPTKD
jgi:hypothetical protein